MKVFVTAVIELMNSGTADKSSAKLQVLTGSAFGFSIKRKTRDRRKHDVQLIHAEQEDI